MTSESNVLQTSRTSVLKKTIKEFNYKRLEEGEEEVVVVLKKSLDKLDNTIDELEVDKKALITLCKFVFTVFGVHWFVKRIWC